VQVHRSSIARPCPRHDALIRLLAKRLGVAPSRVAIAHGHRSRDKVLRIEGLDDAEVRRRVAG
jgi:uncharacterized protein YggU (UPF0235/DUF167 family)